MAMGIGCPSDQCAIGLTQGFGRSLSTPSRYIAKKNRPKPVFFFRELITSKQQEQQPKRLEQQQRPKQQEQQPKRLEQQRQQLELVLEQQQEQRLQEQLLEQERQEQLLLSWSKQPEQQPAGKRSAGIFSWVFLN